MTGKWTEKYNDIAKDSIKSASLIVKDDQSRTYLYAREICESLDYVDYQQAIRIHVHKDDVFYLKDIVADYKKLYKNAQGHTKYINENGLKNILLSSRKYKTIELAKKCGLDVNMTLNPCKEAEILKSICIYLDKYKLEHTQQYIVGKYKIDLYISKLNIGIEIDENNHADRNKQYEAERTNYITKKTGCTFYRYNPDAPTFDIADIYYDLTELIRKIK